MTLFNQYLKFNKFLDNVDLKTFTDAANAANFVDNDYINIMYKNFKHNPSKFLVDNAEGIMFDYFVKKVNN